MFHALLLYTEKAAVGKSRTILQLLISVDRFRNESLHSEPQPQASRRWHET